MAQLTQTPESGLAHGVRSEANLAHPVFSDQIPLSKALGSTLRMNFIQITPFIHVPDLKLALEFFNDLLGFKTVIQSGPYAYLERENVGVRLMENSWPEGAPPGNRRFAYYIDVRDVDGLYEELLPKLQHLPRDHVHGPADKPYGQRELLIVAPDGNLLAFGQAIKT